MASAQRREPLLDETRAAQSRGAKVRTAEVESDDENDSFDRRVSEDPSEERSPFMKSMRKLLSGRRFPSAVVIGACTLFVRCRVPATFSNTGHFGVNMGSVHSHFSLEFDAFTKETVVISSFCSVKPRATIDSLNIGLVEVSGHNVTVAPVVYDAEGYYKRSGPFQPLQPLAAGNPVLWQALPLDKGLETPKGAAGRLQTYFLGIIVKGEPGHIEPNLVSHDDDDEEAQAEGNHHDCTAHSANWRTAWSAAKKHWCCARTGTACQSFESPVKVSLALGTEELYAHSIMPTVQDPHFPIHLVSSEHLSIRKINYNQWETLRRGYVRFEEDETGKKDGAGFLGIQAAWSVERPTWQASLVISSTLFAVVLMTDGVPAYAAFAALLVLFIVTGILTVKEAVSGFAQEGILTVAIFIVVARALDDISYVEEVITRIIGSPASLRMAHLQMMVPTILMSGAIPNTAILAMMTPILNRWAMRMGVSPSQFLMPCSFASLLGSNLTLIGSGANLIAASIFSRVTIRMFDPAPTGIVIAIVGVIYMIIAAPRMLRVHPERSRNGDSKAFRLRQRSEILDQGQAMPANEDDLVPQVEEKDPWDFPVAFRLGLSAEGCSSMPVPTLSVVTNERYKEEVEPQRLVQRKRSKSEGNFGKLAAQSKDGMRSKSWNSLVAAAKLELAGTDQAVSPKRPIDMGIEEKRVEEGHGSAVLPQEPPREESRTVGQGRLYNVRFLVDEAGPLRGVGLRASGIQRVEGANLVEVLDAKGVCIFPKGGKVVLAGGETLCLRVTPIGYHNLRSFRGLRPPPGLVYWLNRLGRGRRRRLLVEAVIQDVESPLFEGVGRLNSSRVLRDLSAVVVGVRRGAVGAQNSLASDRTQTGADSWDGIEVFSGDVLLFDARDLGKKIEGRDEFLLVRCVRDTNPPRAGGLGDRFRAGLGISLLCGLLIITSIPALEVNTLVAAWCVAVLYVLFDLLNFEQVIQTLTYRLVPLLTLMTAIGVGDAFHESGVVELLSGILMQVAIGLGGYIGSVSAAVKIAVFFVVCNFAAFVNMGSSVAIMAPVVQQLVVDMPGVTLRPVAFTLMYAANSPYATPFGASANLMVVDAGGYNFMDFFRFGFPLQLLVMVTAVLMSFVVFPEAS